MQAGTSNFFKIIAADTGVPVASFTQQFSIFVNPLLGSSITQITWTNGRVRLIIPGDPGLNCALQATTNFTTWTNLFVTDSPARPLNWTDTNAGNLLPRLYRVLLVP